MTWIIHKDIPPMRSYLSKGMTPEEIVKDLIIVVKQCMVTKTADKADDAKSLMFYANATNGYIGIYLYDMDEMDQVGDSSYLVELTDFYESIDDAFVYDKITKQSAILFGQSEYGTELKNNLAIYFCDELDDAVSV